MYSKHQKLLSMQCQLQQCPFSDFVCSVEFLYYLHFRYLFRLPISIMRPFFMFNDNLHVQCVNQSISLTTFSLTSTHIRYTVIYLFLVCCFTLRQIFFFQFFGHLFGFCSPLLVRTTLVYGWVEQLKYFISSDGRWQHRIWRDSLAVGVNVGVWCIKS